MRGELAAGVVRDAPRSRARMLACVTVAGTESRNETWGVKGGAGVDRSPHRGRHFTGAQAEEKGCFSMEVMGVAAVNRPGETPQIKQPRRALSRLSEMG